MGQYENKNKSRGASRGSAGSSRSRTASSGYSGAKSSRARSSASSASSGRKSSYESLGSVRRGGQRNRKQEPNYKMIAIGGVLLILVIFGLVMMMKGKGGAQAESSSEAETELQQEVTVDGITITGMSREDAREAILSRYTWGMKVTYNDETYEVENLMGEKVDALLQEIFTGEPKENYSLDTSGLEEYVEKEVANVAEKWDKPAKNGEISEFDKESNSFVYSPEEPGIAIDQEKLKADIDAAIQAKDFTAVIEAQAAEVAPEITAAQAKEMYQVIGQYSTTTTANRDRNTNIQLASECLEGKIIQPGETFSFNDTTGERSESKGYRPAGAYVNGQLVEEPGGGVCQVSSTLYNAVIFSGLNTTERHAHSYEPSYVTPGEDATVSYGGPDMKFVNTSDTAIAIRAKLEGSLGSRMTLTISIVGIPILEDGVKISMHSEKTKELPPPEPEYIEDQTLPPGTEEVEKAGDNGSVWTTNLVTTKNGEVISDEFFHSSRYKGHASVIRRNTSDVQITTSGAEGESGSSAEGEEGVTTVEPVEPGESGSASESSGSPSSDGEIVESQPTATAPVQEPTTSAPSSAGPSAGPGSGTGQTVAPPTGASSGVEPLNPTGETVPAGPGV